MSSNSTDHPTSIYQPLSLSIDDDEDFHDDNLLRSRGSGGAHDIFRIGSNGSSSYQEILEDADDEDATGTSNSNFTGSTTANAAAMKSGSSICTATSTTTTGTSQSQSSSSRHLTSRNLLSNDSSEGSSSQEEDHEDTPLSRSSSMDVSPRHNSNLMSRSFDHHSLDHSNNHSDDDDDDWDDDDDLFTKRYNLGTTETATATCLEKNSSAFDSSPSRSSLASRVFHSVQELRRQARQRRAAMLLHMPDESCMNQVKVAIWSHGLDATNAGIAIVAVYIIIWILVGTIMCTTTATGHDRHHLYYWTVGALILVFRFSARRLWERFGGTCMVCGCSNNSNSHHGLSMSRRSSSSNCSSSASYNNNRQRLGTGDAVEFQRDWQQQQHQQHQSEVV